MGLLCRRFPPNLQMNSIDRNKWSLLEPLLEQVLDLAPEERTRWLAELSGRLPAPRCDPGGTRVRPIPAGAAAGPRWDGHRLARGLTGGLPVIVGRLAGALVPWEA